MTRLCFVFVLLFSLVPALGQAPASAPAPEKPAAKPPVPLVGALQDRLAGGALEGWWVAETGVGRVTLHLRTDGRFSLDGTHGTYTVDGNRLLLTSPSGQASYEFDVSGGVLTLRGGDLRKETSFTRQAVLADYVADFAQVTPAALRHKFSRIVVIVVIVVVARLLIYLLQGISHLIVFYDWGPLGLIYRRNKARVRTLHALVLNIVMYVIYFAALGLILSELGVNYTAYLASLSVVGLAIGFGSQGLVQDTVTGFFIILEAQFDVGDMVEIAGQTGVVTELGLRTTRIRNYYGEILVIPNRSLAVVGRYRLMSQLGLVDVAIKDAGDAERASAVVTRVGQELSRQFAGVLFNEPTLDPMMELETGERFVRARVLFWPGQTWVVEAQLVPRIREAFAREKLEIPGERIVVFYHPREAEETFDWRKSLQDRLSWATKPLTGKGEGV